MPKQRIPQRNALSSTVGKPFYFPHSTTQGIAPNIGGNPSTNPNSAPLRSYFLGADEQIIAVSQTVTANSFGPTVTQKVTFANILGMSNTQPLYVPPTSNLYFIVWAQVLTAPLNLIPGSLTCAQYALDDRNVAHNSTLALPPGTYKRFGANVTTNFYNPTGTGIATSFSIAVYGMLYLGY